jgi:hypothetical protein
MKEYTSKDYNKMDDDSLGVNHPIQTNKMAKYNNHKGLINISQAEDTEQNDQI